eukprot:Skav207981  [mRNA]  locus=scaffold4447:15308:19097:- [translate_table: standard]
MMACSHGASRTSFRSSPAICVSESASLEDIRKAFLQRAKSAHPDVVGSGSGDMVQLNLCYEALTQRRKEYDAAKGVTGQKKTFTSGTSSFNSREAWWQEMYDWSSDEEEIGHQTWILRDYREWIKPRGRQKRQRFDEAVSASSSADRFATAQPQEHGKENPKGRGQMGQQPRGAW